MPTAARRRDGRPSRAPARAAAGVVGRRPARTPVPTRGSRSDKAPRGALASREYSDPTACERCGAIYARKTWRRRRSVEPELLRSVSWDVCPACDQEARGQFYGRVVIRGALDAEREQQVLRRIENVAERAEFTQPERRVVEVRREGGELEVRTTSQKLAHRIAHELQKAFQGRTRYAWSDRDGRLLATWES